MLLQAQLPENIYIGTFAEPGSKGIYVTEFNRKNHTLQVVSTANAEDSPSFLAFGTAGHNLYAVNRGGVGKLKQFGSVGAYSVDSKTGKLKLINQVSSFGNGPCHLSTDKSGRWLFVSHYGSGNLVVFPVKPDGSIGAPADSVRHSGKGAHETRQEKPHVHSALITSDNRFLLVADLGTDKLMIYRFDPASGKLTPGEQPFWQARPGTGPRHFAFHPQMNRIYVAGELSNTVEVLDFKPENGSIRSLQRVSSLPGNFIEPNTTADIHLTSDGKFLYISNRGHNSLAGYQVDPKTGLLKLIGFTGTEGEHPRNFMIDPLGEFILVANRDTDNVTVFEIDEQTGVLEFTGSQVSIPSPVCVKMQE
jgi:6-phosphogluconolactonase